MLPTKLINGLNGFWYYIELNSWNMLGVFSYFQVLTWAGECGCLGGTGYIRDIFK